MKIYENLLLENLNGEIWKNIDGYNGDYQVSNFGRFKSFKGKKEKILKQNKNIGGYLYIRLSKDGKKKPKLIHILMFETFNDYELKDDECIHHLNENKLDNNLKNFQLMTKFEHKSFHNSGEKHPLYGKRHSEKTKKLMKQNHADFSGKNNPMYGIKHPEKTKKLIKDKMIGKYFGSNNPMFGKTGEKSGHHILTEQKVIEIRIDLDEGILTQKEIGKKFGVNQSTISSIKIGRNWKHILKDLK